MVRNPVRIWCCVSPEQIGRLLRIYFVCAFSGPQKVGRILRRLHTFVLQTVRNDKSSTRSSKKNVTEFRSFVDSASGNTVGAKPGAVNGKKIPNLEVRSRSHRACEADGFNLRDNHMLDSCQWSKICSAL